MAGPRWLMPFMGAAILLTLVVSLVDCALDTQEPVRLLNAAGAVLMLTGAVLRSWAIKTLGRYFLDEVTILPDQPLVTCGPFAYLRHPSELGTMCLVLGSAMVLGSLTGAVLFVVLIVPCVLWRTRLEDVVLAHHFPVEFAAYCRQVHAFRPVMRATFSQPLAILGPKNAGCPGAECH
ncbi:MAG TPA: isoprenylcysteine carboxylmethyltransferase family protein [Pirellulales bacterium]